MGYSSRSRTRTKAVQARTTRPRIVMRKSNQHLYATVVDSTNSVLTHINTLSLIRAGKLTLGSNIAAAEALAEALHIKLEKMTYRQFAYNRAGWPYHGRLRAFAEKLRELGLQL